MRVLITSHLYPSTRRPGDAPWLAEQVCALKSAGVDVSVLCCSQAEADHDLTATFGGCEVPVAYRSTSVGMLDGTRAGLLASALRYERRLAGHLEGLSGAPDAIHAHFAFPDGWAAARVGHRLGIPTLLTVHGSDVTRVVARPGRLGDRIRRDLSRLDAVVSVSDELDSHLRAALPGVPTRVIPNGYNDALFRPGDGERDLGFLFVGALLPVKNVELLIEVYLATPGLHALPLTVAGTGPLRERIEEMVAAAPPGARVTLLGSLAREQTADAMRRARALVVPSRREGFGVVAAESLASGTPVVGSRVGGLPDILAGPAAGILVEPDDRAQLADAMLEMLEWAHSPTEVRESSGAAPWSERARELAALYHECLADTPEPRRTHE